MVKEDDITQEILLRLPVKSLVRCKSLSKVWMDFISCNPAFRRRFIDRNKGCSFMLGFYITKHVRSVNNGKVRFLPTYNRGISMLNKRKRDNNDDGASWQLHQSPEKKKCSSPTLLLKKSPNFFNDPAAQVVGSSNGFLLCSLEEKHHLNYFIINPLNKLCMSLQAASATNSNEFAYTHGFFCRSKSPQLDTVDYYKVVRRVSPRSWHQESLTTLEIISSDSNQWSQFHVRGESPFYMDIKNPSKIIVSETGLIYVPGVVPKQDTSRTWFRRNNSVLIFDQSKQEPVHVMELPSPENGTAQECFGESDGMISYARNEKGQLKIWRYNEQEGSGWSLVHNVSLERWVYHLRSGNRSTSGFFPTAFHPTDKNVLFLATDKGRLVYNLDKSKMDYFWDETVSGLSMLYYFIPYTCGLIGPHLFLSQD